MGDVVVSQTNDPIWVVWVPGGLSQPFVVLIADDEQLIVLRTGSSVTVSDANLVERNYGIGMLMPDL